LREFDGVDSSLDRAQKEKDLDDDTKGVTDERLEKAVVRAV
jgi:hypothetical protein